MPMPILNMISYDTLGAFCTMIWSLYSVSIWLLRSAFIDVVYIHYGNSPLPLAHCGLDPVPIFGYIADYNFGHEF